MSGVRSYILDTNIVSDLIRWGRESVVLATLRAYPDRRAHLSAVVVAEIRHRLARKGSPGLTARAEPILGSLPILPFDAPAARRYGEIRADLERRGRVIGDNDMLIAAQGLALGMGIVTDNVDEFARVEGLTVVNWLVREARANPVAPPGHGEG